MAVVAVVASLLSVVPTAQAPSAEAAVAADFSPGNIISDAQFFDGDAMSAGQVQAFLDGQLQRCSTGYTCLKDYQQATPAMPANAYCDAVPARGTASSSQIIADVSIACGISPRVLLVLLQKEQSLVTHPAPTAIRYQKATGFACPDTAPCDASFGGFYYQVYYAARQFQRYAAHPLSYAHRAGETNRIWWHPNQACGSSSVFIENQATAGLYNYTPYRPNAAALGNLYGTGDSCSAYGNRNFWRMYTDWFGDPRKGEGTSLLRDASSGRVYLLVGQRRHHVPTPAILAEFTSAMGQSRDATAAELGRYTEGAALSRHLQGADGSILLVDNGVSHRFANCAQVQGWQLSCTGLVRLDAATEGLLTRGAPMSMTVQGTDGHDWLIQSGTRRELADITHPTRYGYPSATVELDPDAVAHFPVGTPALDAGTAVRNAAGTVVRIKTPTAVVALSGAQAALPAMRSVAEFTDASLGKLVPGSATVPSRFRSGSAGYLLTGDGVLRVDAAHYGGIGAFPASGLADQVLGSLPSAGTELRPHFVRERGTALLYLAGGAKLQPVADQAAYDFIRTRFGVPGQIREVPAGALDGVPKAVEVEVGEFVHGSTGRVHLWDGARAMYVMHPAFATALGVEFSSRRVADDVLRGLPEGPWLGGFGFRCGTTDLVAIDGELRPFTSAAVAAEWGLNHVALDPAFCEQLTISSAAVGQFVVDPAGRTYLMDDGRARYVPNRAVLSELGGTLSGRTPMPSTAIALLPKGADAIPGIEPGSFVRGGDGRVYLWDGARADYVMHPDFATALGLRFDVQSLSSSTVASLPKGPWIGGYRFTCAGTPYVAFDGALHRYASDAAAAAWQGPSVELAPALCSELTVSSTTLSRFVYEPNGRTYVVEAGALRYIPSSAVYAELGGREAGRTLIPASMVQRLPKGTSY